MKRTLTTITLSLMLFGCAEPTSPPQDYLASRSTEPNTPSPDIKTFTWGDATITTGMTKIQVMDQIAKSGQTKWQGKYGIKTPPAEMQTLEKWDLYFGNPTGAAPGGAVITFNFENGKLIKITIGPAFA